MKFETVKPMNRACQRCLEKLKAYELIGDDTLKKASALSIYIKLDYGKYGIRLSTDKLFFVELYPLFTLL